MNQQKASYTPLMVLGTSSGAGKSLMSTAICRVLRRRGETPLPFKGQNMSNNAWVDDFGKEMAYSQAVQAWAANIQPQSAMNPILLKPKSDSTSEVIHLGKSVGVANAENYYEQWFRSGWLAIREGLKDLEGSYPDGRLIIEGAGSPVEVNLQHRDLTNLRLAQFLRANCLLVADIERGGVFAQIIGTLALLKPFQRRLIKGVLINRFRGRRELFNEGKEWIIKKTGIPVIGIMPWLKEIYPPEDSLDLINRDSRKKYSEIEIAVIKLPSLSNFSDLDPLEAEPSIQLRWVQPGSSLGSPDAVVIPGSKQTIKDLTHLFRSGLANQLQDYNNNGGIIFGICGGMQMLGEYLFDPLNLEGSCEGTDAHKIEGIGLLPIQTVFESKKSTKQRSVKAFWPNSCQINGFELHHGNTFPLDSASDELQQLTEDCSIGWIIRNKREGIIAGTYLHGIFDNGPWRRLWINQIRESKGLRALNTDIKDHALQRESILDKLADSFEEYTNIDAIL